MKQFLISFGILFFSYHSDAQLNLQYTNTRQAPASHNMTVLDQVTDNSGNIYVLYSDDPSKILLLSRVNVSGTTLWTDTVSVPGFPQVNVITARINIGQNKLYLLFPGYGPSPAGAIVAIYDLSGNYLNGFNASNLGNVWTYGVHGIHEKANGNILVYYSYGDQFTSNDTMYVKEFTANFSPVWTLKYNVPKLTWYCPNLLDAAGNFYFTYTNDSVAGANHYLRCYTRKADNNGNIVWTNTSTNVVNRYMKKLPNNDIALAGNNNPAGSIFGNNTGDALLSRLNDLTGDTVWTRSYNGANNEREDINGLTVDALNNIYVVGTEDIHDYNPVICRSFLQKYDASGTLMYDKKIPAVSSAVGIFSDALSNINTVSILGNSTVHLKKIIASTGDAIDSLSTNVTYAMGMGATSNNTDDDIFFTYSEGHCGANHLEVLRFCTKAVCLNPDAVDDMSAEDAGVILYPNPAYASIAIAQKGQPRIEHVTVYSMSGVKMNTAFDGQYLDITSLSNGLYLVQLELNNKKLMLKFIKN